jgi:Fe2+ or Zn2+ uptake regulation protein
MGQIEIIDFLSKHKGEWLTAEDIFIHIKDINKSTFYDNMRSLVKYRVVEIKNNNSLLNKSKYLYCLKK